MLDLGRWPSGADGIAEALARSMSDSGFDVRVRDDIMRWKYAKLLGNLGNAAEALCGPSERSGWIEDGARAEGVACLEAAGIDFAGEEEETARRGHVLSLRPINGKARPGGSSWQSLRRQTGNIEADYLNGEIVMLGRLHGVPTPINALLQSMANEAARTGLGPGAITESDFRTRLKELRLNEHA
jgi:2-dehydropantoate 2-reductase